MEGKAALLNWDGILETHQGTLKVELAKEASSFETIHQAGASTHFNAMEYVLPNCQEVFQFRLRLLLAGGDEITSNVATLRADPQNCPSYQFYPNPISSNLLVKAPHGSELKQVKIWNLDGKCILEWWGDSADLDLDLESWTSGVYLLQAHSNDGSILKEKLFKN